MSNAITLAIQLQATDAGATKVVREFEKSLRSLKKTGELAAYSVDKAISANNVTGAAQKQVQSIGKVNKALNQQVKQAQLAREHGALLANAWNEGSNVVDKRYLKSISSLRESLYRANKEFQNTYTIHKGYIKSMSDMDLAHARFMIKGNLITRTMSNMSTHMINMGKNAQWTGRQLMVGVTAPIIGLGAVAVKTALEIEKLDLQLQKVGRDLDLTALDKSARQLSTTLGISRKEIKAVQADFARVGFDEAQIRKATEMTLNLSVIGDTDVESAKELVRILAQSGMGWEELQDQLEKFNKIDDDTNLSLKETIGSLEQAYPTLKNLGITASETAALMSGITQEGFQASEAANALNAIFTKLPSALANMNNGASGGANRLKDLQEQLRQTMDLTGININLFDQYGKQLKGTKIIYDVAKAFKELDESNDPKKISASLQLARALFGAERMAEGQSLLRQAANDSSDLSKALKIANADLGAFAQKWATELQLYKDSDGVRLANSLNDIANSASDIGKKLIPYVQQALDFVRKIVNWFEGLSEGVKKMAISFGVALAALGPIIYAGGQSMIVLGSVAKGLISPFKSFFKIVKGHKDDWDWTDDAIEGLMNLNDKFVSGKVSRDEYLTGLNKLVDSTMQNVDSSVVLKSAVDSHTASALANAKAIDSQALAQARLNAMNSAGLRIGNKSELIRPDAKEAGEAVSISRSVGEQSAKERIMRALEKRTPLPTYGVKSAEKIRILGTESRMGSGSFERIQELQRVIRQADAQIEGLGSNGDINMLARMFANEQNMFPDLSGFEDKAKDIENIKKEINTFTRAWRQAPPLDLDLSIEDPYEQLKDYNIRLNKFQDALATTIGDIARQSGTTINNQLVKDLTSNPQDVKALWNDALLKAGLGGRSASSRPGLPVRDSINAAAKDIVRARDAMIGLNEPEFLTPYMMSQIKEEMGSSSGMQKLFGGLNDAGFAGKQESLMQEAFAKYQSQATDPTRLARGKDPLEGLSSDMKRIVNSSRETLPGKIGKQFKEFQQELNAGFVLGQNRQTKIEEALDEAIKSTSNRGKKAELKMMRRRLRQRASLMKEALDKINSDISFGIVPDQQDIFIFQQAEKAANATKASMAQLLGNKSAAFKPVSVMAEENLSKFDEIFGVNRTKSGPMPGYIKEILDKYGLEGSDTWEETQFGMLDDVAKRRPRDLSRYGRNDIMGKGIGKSLRGSDSAVATKLSTDVNKAIFSNVLGPRENYVQRGMEQLASQWGGRASYGDGDAVEGLRDFIVKAYESQNPLAFISREGLSAEVNEALSRSLYAGYGTAEAIKPITNVLGKEYTAQAQYLINQLSADILEQYDNVDVNNVLDYRKRAVMARKDKFETDLANAEKEMIELGKQRHGTGRLKKPKQYAEAKARVDAMYASMSSDDIKEFQMRKMNGGVGGRVSTYDTHTSTRGLSADQVQAFAPEAQVFSDLSDPRMSVASVDDLLSDFDTSRSVAEKKLISAEAAVKKADKQLADLEIEKNKVIKSWKDRVNLSAKRNKRSLVKELDAAKKLRDAAQKELDDMMIDAFRVTFDDGTTKIYDNEDMYIRDMEERVARDKAALSKKADELLGIGDGPQKPEKPERAKGKGATAINKANSERYRAEVEQWEKDVQSWELQKKNGEKTILAEIARLEAVERDLDEKRTARLMKAMDAADARAAANAATLQKRNLKRELLGFTRTPKLTNEERAVLTSMHLSDANQGIAQRTYTRADIADAAIGTIYGPEFGPALPGKPTMRSRVKDAVVSPGRRGRAGSALKSGAGAAFTVANAATNPVKQAAVLSGGVKKLGTSLKMLVSEGGAATTVMSGLFGPTIASSASSIFSVALPLLPIAAALAAVGLVLWKNFSKWIDTARPGLMKLKEAGAELLNAVLEPLRGMFRKLNGEGEDTGNMWNNIGTIIGKTAEGIAWAFRAITPVVKFTFENIATIVYTLVQVVRAIIALITGDWEDFGEALKSAWSALWKGMARIVLEIAKGIIKVISNMLTTIIDLMVGIIPTKAFGFEIPGADKLEKGLKAAKKSINGIRNDLSGSLDDLIPDESKWAEQGKKNAKAMADGAATAGAFAGDAAAFIDPEEAKAAAEEAAKDFINAFKSRLGEAVDAWRQAALKAYDDWADSQVQAIDDKIDAIDKEIEAERKRDEDLEYLRRKEELRERKRSEAVKFRADRALAIYEGRYDDAKQMSYDYAVSQKDIKKEEDALDSDRSKTLVQRERDLQKEILNEQKDALQKQLDAKRAQFEAELEMYTEYLPRNAEAAAAMQQGILDKLGSFTGGHAKIGEDQASAWGKSWASAMDAAKKDIADEAWWAGQEAITQFALGLGIDPEVLKGPPTVDPNQGMGGGDYGIVSEGNSSDALGQSGEIGASTGYRRQGSWHTGGNVPGSGEVDAKLLAGEYVMQRSAVNKYGPHFMNMVNGGKLKYHTGGMVSAAAAAMSTQFRKFYADFMGSGLGFSLIAGANKIGITADTVKNALSSAAGGPNVMAQMIEGIYPGFMDRFNKFNAAVGNKFRVVSGYRSIAEQQRLYDLWLAGKGNLAAPPGQSYHNFGLAMDIAPNSTPEDRSIAERFGLRFPMSFEPWHVEPVDAAAIRQSMMSGSAYSDMFSDTGVGSGGFKLNADLINRIRNGVSVGRIPSLDIGGLISKSGIAEVHRGERVLTAGQTAAYDGGSTKVEAHFHFEGGYFGTDRELEKLVDRMEKEIIPKVNRPRSGSTRVYGGVTK